jgi:hypothetical protein
MSISKGMVSLTGSMLEIETGPVNALKSTSEETQASKKQKIERADTKDGEPQTDNIVKKRKKHANTEDDAETILQQKKSIPEVKKKVKIEESITPKSHASKESKTPKSPTSKETSASSTHKEKDATPKNKKHKSPKSE